MKWAAGCIGIILAVVMAIMAFAFLAIRIRNQAFAPVYTIPRYAHSTSSQVSDYLDHMGLAPQRDEKFSYRFDCGGKHVTVKQTTTVSGRRVVDVSVDGELVGRGKEVNWKDRGTGVHLYTECGGRLLFLIHPPDDLPMIVIRVYPDWRDEPRDVVRSFKGRRYHLSPGIGIGDEPLAITNTYLTEAAITCVNPAADTKKAEFPKYLPELFHEVVATFKGDIPR